MRIVIWSPLLISVMLAACKPITKRQPLSREQSLIDAARVVFKHALQNGEVDKVVRMLREQYDRIGGVFVNKILRAQVKNGNYETVKKLVTSYEVSLHKANIEADFAQLQHANILDDFSGNLKKLESTLATTFHEFGRWEYLIDTTYLIPDTATGRKGVFHAEQMHRLREEFAAWADPLRKEIDTAIRDFFKRWQPGDGSSGGVVRVWNSWDGIKEMLDSKF